ncbi:MAG: divalent-cation tolerance protein CutA [Acidobacteria bacterium]|nr:divalent-cation tolerance protein CutA [Acidobacteriota bacterium]
MSGDEAIVVLSSAGRHEEAASIAASLVERRLAACVQVVPGVTSFYRWEGAVEQSGECLLVVKTTAARYDEVEGAIRELHSYVTPEIVRLRVEGGSSAYVDWLRESVV